MSKKINADIAEVGFAFELCAKNHPEINLYQEDSVHPSKEGSYLIACVFYKYITRKNVADVRYNADINSEEAEKIRKLVNLMSSSNER